MTDLLRENEKRKKRSFFLAGNCLTLLFLLLFAAFRCGTVPACSVTVRLMAPEKEAAGGILMEAVRIGTVSDQDGRICPENCYGIREWPSGAENTAQAVAKLDSVLKKRRAEGSVMESSVHFARTGQDGVCVFRELPEGAYLIRQADEKSPLKIEAAAVALSEKSGKMGQTGNGLPEAVSDAEIWPKAVSSADLPPESVTLTGASRRQAEALPPSEKSEKKVLRQRPRKGRNKEERKRKEETETPAASSPPPEVRTGDFSPLKVLAFAAFISFAVILLCLSVLLRSVSAGRFMEKVLRKTGGRRTGFCLALLLLISCAGRVSGGEQEYDYAAHADDVCRITFQNVREEGTALYVSKKLLDSEGREDSGSGSAFSFHLTLNGKKASEREYRLIGPDGRELFNYGTREKPLLSPQENPAGLKLPFSCDSYGNFTLRAGETAVFGDLRGGSAYEVTENCPEGYETVSPEGVPAFSGSIGEEGSRVLFVNRRLPDSPPGETAELHIRKAVPFPEGLEKPDFPAFRIQLKIDGKKWSSREISFRRSDSGAFVRDSSTDEEGILEIFPGETAVLKQLPRGAEYEATELCELQPGNDAEPSLSSGHLLSEEDFCLFGLQVRRGSVDNPETLVFTNLLASFLVSKTVRNTDMQRAFSFVLTDGENRPAAGKKYLLYDAEGQLVPPAEKTGGPASEEGTAEDVGKNCCHVTDQKGRFLLKAGQKAVFIGMLPGTRFSVREEASYGFTQVTPESADGYRDRVVSESPQTLVFENISAPGLLLPDAGGGGIWVFLLLSLLPCFVLVQRMICGEFLQAEGTAGKTGRGTNRRHGNE